MAPKRSREAGDFRVRSRLTLSQEEICEEDFLKTCSASKKFVCAFYHSEMRLCAIMNEILGVSS